MGSLSYPKHDSIQIFLYWRQIISALDISTSRDPVLFSKSEEKIIKIAITPHTILIFIIIYLETDSCTLALG